MESNPKGFTDWLQGEKMSRLKQVDDEWILRRLERCEQCG